MKVTIKDVARKANVAPSTVSRVIADHPKITQETKEKVRKVMKELGYHPNLLARKLVTQSSQTIGVIRRMVSEEMIIDPFFPEALQGISDYLRSENYSTISVNTVSKDVIFEEVEKMVHGKNVDGIILLYSHENDPTVKFLIENKVPIIMLGKPAEFSDQIMYVNNDNVKAMYDMTQYLIRLGHENIAYIGRDPSFEVHKDREQGFKMAMMEANLDIKHIYHSVYATNSSQQIVDEIIQLNPRPTVLMTIDELSAMSMMSALYKRRLSIPDDISIVSFNNSLLSKISSPPLTTMDIHPYQLGHETAKSLINQLKYPEAMKHNILVPTTIVERESCKKL